MKTLNRNMTILMKTLVLDRNDYMTILMKTLNRKKEFQNKIKSMMSNILKKTTIRRKKIKKDFFTDPPKPNDRYEPNDTYPPPRPNAPGNTSWGLGQENQFLRSNSVVDTKWRGSQCNVN